MKVNRNIVFINIFFFFFLNLFGQEQISFRQLSVKEGLSQNSVVSVAQDSTGYLWIATQNGLNKYDGKKFTNYRFDFVDITRPTYSHLGKIYVDRKGDVFIIPLDRKLYKYNTMKDVFEPITETLNVSSIYHDKNHNYWIGTYAKGIYVFDETLTKREVIVSEDEISSTIYSISQLYNDKILATTDEKLIEINIQSKIVDVIEPTSIFSINVVQNFSSSIYDQRGKQWIGTFGDGLYFKEKNSKLLRRFSDSEFSDPLPNNLNILELYVDSSERLWIATYGSGLYKIDFNSQKISHFTADKYNPKAIHYNDVLCIYEDYTGTLWFGTDGAGLSYYDEFLEKFNSFTNLQTPEHINIDVVRAIAVDNKQNVWIGTSGKGLTEYEPSTNSWRTFTTLNSAILSDRVMSLYVDNDNLWIGTQGNGLVFYNENTGFSKAKGLDAKTIWNIFKDSQGRMWLGTQNHGLIQFDRSKGVLKKFEANQRGFTSNNIRIITEDDQNNLWIGTDNEGILKLNKTTETITSFKRSNSNNSLSGNGIKSLYFDKNAILWIGTNGNGLNGFDSKNEKFHRFTEEDGLANNVIYAILPDSKNNLWLSSNKGITSFSADNTFNNVEVKNYNNYAGLAAEFNTGAYYKHTNGELYYGGLEGFYWFNPNTIKENIALPKTTITGFDVLNQNRSLLENTILKHNENTLTFTFSSLQFSLPEKNLYQYKLLNYDEEWIEATTNSVRYTRLAPGTYEFQVKSSNYDGVWNETPSSFSFKINAPWYFNFYAKVVYLVLFLTALYSIYRYFKWRWLMKLNLQLQEQEAQRLQQLNDYKSKLYIDVAHEFRTPLTLISAPIDSKLTEGNLSDYDHANFSVIKRNANRLTALVDQLLQLAKLEQGKQQLKVSQGNLGLFLHSITESFQYKAATKEIDFQTEIAKIDRAWYDEDVIEKIVSNLLSNAIKYTPAKGNCNVKAIARNTDIHIIVENTIDQAITLDTEKLFNRFYQENQYADGIGVGLSLVKELIKLYGGFIEVKTKNNSILFSVQLPINKKDFVIENVIIEETQQHKANQKLVDNVAIQKNENGNEKAEKPILLIVEDNDEVRTFISRSLRHKYQTLEATNGQQGIEQALEHVPDIVLSDVRMPERNGIDLCNTLKQDERTSHIPIILLTADTGEENELKGLESGADDFVTKPFKLRVLEKRLANLIELRRALRDRYSQEYVLKPTDISLTSTDKAFLNKLQEIIDEDFSNPDFSAVTFCKKTGMSRMQLHRKLLAYTGLSTSAFIRSQRLKQAVQILKTSDATINEVAYTVGFNTPSYFIKCFKEVYKKTPSEYLQCTGI